VDVLQGDADRLGEPPHGVCRSSIAFRSCCSEIRGSAFLCCKFGCLEMWLSRFGLAEVDYVEVLKCDVSLVSRFLRGIWRVFIPRGNEWASLEYLDYERTRSFSSHV
jgi:hypothetical protein